MGLWQLMLPALGGYFFLISWNRTKYRIYRKSGYQLFFEAVAFGLILFVVARVFVVAIEGWVPGEIEGIWSRLLPFDYSGTLAIVAATAVAVPKLLNRWYTEDEGAYDAAKHSGDCIELLLQDSIAKPRLVEVSMRSGKSYMGFVNDSSIGIPDEADVTLVPVWSGYRDVKTKELRITADYRHVLMDGNHNIHGKHFIVVVPMSEIISACPFDPKIYNQLRSTNRNPELPLEEHGIPTSEEVKLP